MGAFHNGRVHNHKNGTGYRGNLRVLNRLLALQQTIERERVLQMGARVYQHWRNRSARQISAPGPCGKEDADGEMREEEVGGGAVRRSGRRQGLRKGRRAASLLRVSVAFVGAGRVAAGDLGIWGGKGSDARRESGQGERSATVELLGRMPTCRRGL
jgi:hypothetical protein